MDLRAREMMIESQKKYGLARKFNPRTGRKEWCIAVFSGDYPDIPIHFFGPTRPTSEEIARRMTMAPVLERQARNDYVIKQFPYGVL